MQNSAGYRRAFEPHRLRPLLLRSRPPRHVATADEVERKPEAISKMVQSTPTLLGRRNAAEEHDVAFGSDLAQHARALCSSGRR